MWYMLEHTFIAMQSTKNYRNRITQFAKRQGFDLVGFSKPAIDSRYLKAYKKWLGASAHADMSYMEKSAPLSDLSLILSGAKSVIVFGMNYYRPQSPLRSGHARVARYAFGRDYHKIISKKLKNIENFIKTFPSKNPIQTKSYVDTGPILERAFAEQSGLGTIGKNSCLITKEFGSWVFLAEIITTLEISPPPRETASSVKSVTGHTFPNLSTRVENQPRFHLCGRCTRCIDSCPTKAIIAPGIIDARRCIAYHTIENKGKIPPSLAKKIKTSRRLFGCDICQEVCPHNIARQKPTTHKDLTQPKIAGDQLSLKKILSMKSDEQFLKTFAGSPLMRAKLRGLKKTAESPT